MKKILKVLSLAFAPVIAVCAFLTGCKSCKGKAVDGETKEEELMRDIDVAPTQKPYYEEQSRRAYAEYKAVADRHRNAEGDVDMFDSEVVAAANKAAAELYAYACYNERTLDKYVYFSDQEGLTDMGSTGSAKALRQEYFLRVNENPDTPTCGYRYHSTIKKVVDSSGAVSGFKGQFESARVRMTDKTNLLYRFEGNDIRYGEYNSNIDTTMLTCDWRTNSKDWGQPNIEMKKGSEIPTLEGIKKDIEDWAGDDNHTIRGNINILADNIVKYASIVEDDAEDCISIMMVIDTEVANNDPASVTMLTKANGTSGDCQWKSYDDPDDSEAVGFSEDTGLRFIVRLWKNGLFRSFTAIERWRGKIVMFNGTAESQTSVYYSYSDFDCDMTGYLNMLEKAKELV